MLFRTQHIFSCMLILVLVVASLLPISAAEQKATTIAKASAKAPSPMSVTTVPARLVNGAPVFFRVITSVPLQSLKGTWLGHEVVFDHGKGKAWFLLAAVSLETKPGIVPLTLEGTTESGSSIEYRRNVLISRAKYPVVKLTVSKQFTEPNPQQQATIKQDQEIKHKTFSETSPEREWSGKFVPPVDAAVSDVFGTRRVFNGVTKSVHQGLDYRVPPGAPVNAINSGTVILAQPLYFEGNCVTIDHGQGLLSLYLHLSELKVKVGDKVERNQEIGLSGATGRATGPHLHVAVRWQGVYLDPAALLSLNLPAD
jgi:murein DD-endopeptidase MepM/ murein hydrolase activator NlpD